MDTPSQLTLFGTHDSIGEREVASARIRMQAMIDRLRTTTVPFWRDEMAVILDDGAFQRAMHLVPPAEAQALWAEFDAQMNRVYAIWAAADPSRSAPAP